MSHHLSPLHRRLLVGNSKVSRRFWLWLEHYEVDACSGIFTSEQIAHHGFPLPVRSADAIWYIPDALTERSTGYPINPIQWEWWQEGEAVLGMKQVKDRVTGDDHFTWYRLPSGDIAQRLQKQHDLTSSAMSSASSVVEPARFVEEITVDDPDTRGPVALSVYKTSGGGMLAIDSSYLDQVCTIVPSPFDGHIRLDLAAGESEEED